VTVADRNFDDLAPRFRRNIYDRLKGQVRLAVLRRDLAAHVPALAGLNGIQPDKLQPLEILDAGGGQGQLAAELAAFDHDITLCDISANMLSLAREQFANNGLEARFLHRSIQDLCRESPSRYDLILCHAVLEWVAEPDALLVHLNGALQPGGFLSLTFYNLEGMVMKNLLRANFGKILKEDFSGYRGSLTPTWPRTTGEVLAWLEPLQLQLVSHTGIRCFHDYILDPVLRDKDPEQQVALELQLSQREPYRSLGRYIHLLLKKPDQLAS
jgi:tRNA 5-carboxymethoxyuridine methyltransferase